jgi:signal transduction histidine kinase
MALPTVFFKLRAMWGRPLSRPQQLSDLALAAALTAFGELEALAWSKLAGLWSSAQRPLSVREHIGLAIAILGLTATLALRRRFPVPVLLVALASAMSTSSFNPEGGALAVVLGVAIASFTVGYELDPPATWLGPLIVPGLAWLGLALGAGRPSDYFFVAVIYGTPWVFGAALRLRQRRVQQLTRHADDLEREGEAIARAAVTEERARIARELHDVVSHSISVIAIQSQAVRRRLRPDQVQEAEDLRLVETTARQAMAEMRRLFGVLRKDGQSAELAPQPGLDQLDGLVAQVQAAGVHVQVERTGRPVPLPPGLDLVAYRVLQEALTNVIRHRGPGTRTCVHIGFGEQLELEVEDDGRGQASPGTESGHGLIGMRERVTLYGGRLETGGLGAGGYRVHVRLPLTDARMA